MVKIPLKWKDVQVYYGEPPVPHQILARNPWPRLTQPFWIARQYPGGPNLPGGRVLVAFINDNHCYDGSPANKSILCLTNMGRGGRHPPHDWRDNVFVLRKKNMEDPEFQDAVWEEDLPILQSFLRRY